MKRALKFAVLTLLCYLLQSTVAAHLAVWDIAPNLALAIIAVVTVAMGRKATFIMAATVGYLLEIMLPMLDYMNMLLYPVCAMLGALAFSDKGERKLEEERTTGKRTRELNPHLRTPLCALVSIAVFELVNLIYIYLNGVNIQLEHLLRAFVDVAYTTLLAGALQFPIRWWLGMYRPAERRV